MLSLQLLGGLSLSDDSGALSGPATQRRRLALLARVAAAPQASIGREKLITCFWPDEERERARHFLADSVFALRKALGKDVLVSTGDDLRLNREAITCDLWSFLAEAEGGHAVRAIEAYQGPFLDGFFVGDAPEFERWTEEERGHLARRFAECLEQAAREADRCDGPAGGLSWWRRLAAHDPYNSRVALQLMRSLAANGERPAALQHARIHAALLLEELGVPPDPEVERFAASLLTEPPVDAVFPRPAPASENPPRPIDPIVSPSAIGSVPDGLVPGTAPEGALSESDALERAPTRPQAHPPAGARPHAGNDSEAPAPPPNPSPSKPPRPRAHRHPAALVVPLLLIVILGIAALWRNTPREEHPATGAAAANSPVRTIAILPFAYQGAAEHAYLSGGLVTLLATSLHGASNLRAHDPYAVLSRASFATGRDSSTPIPLREAGEIASELGADLILLGAVAQSGAGFRLTASLYRAGEPPAAIRTTAVEGADPAELVDRLARDLLVAELRQPADRVTLVASATTASVPALKAYLEGEQAFRAGHYDHAVEALERAVREDPTFALAYYRLSTAAEWSFRFAAARRAAREALELATALPERDRRLINAWHAFVHGDADRAELLYNAVLTENPGDVEARSGLGEVLVHFNAVRGRLPSEARPAFERVLRVAPDFGEARFHLMEMEAERRDLIAFDSLLARVDPNSTQGRAWRLARAVVGRDATALENAVDSLSADDDLVIAVAAVRAAVHFRDLRAAEALATALTLPGRPASWRAAGLLMNAQGSLARGSPEEADRALRAAREMEPGWALEIGALGLLLPHAAPSREALIRARDELEAWNPRAVNPELSFFFGVHADAHAELRLYLLTLLDLRLDDDAAAEEHLAELRARGEGPSGIGISLASSAAAHRAWYRGEVDQALRILEADRPEIPLERIALSPFFARALDRYLRAEALAALGRTEDALRWHASLTAGPDILFWTAAHQRQAELLRDAGQVAAARLHEQRLRSLVDPPPALTNADQARPAGRPFPIPRADAFGP